MDLRQDGGGRGDRGGGGAWHVMTRCQRDGATACEWGVGGACRRPGVSWGAGAGKGGGDEGWGDKVSEVQAGPIGPGNA